MNHYAINMDFECMRQSHAAQQSDNKKDSPKAVFVPDWQ